MDTAAVAADASEPRQFPGADAVMAALILSVGVFLVATGGSLAERWRSSAARQQSVGFEDQLGLFANAIGLIVITWWTMSLAIAVLSALLERGGRAGAAAATAKFSPAFMRRLALAAVGFQLLAAPLASAATPPHPEPGSPNRPAVSASWTPTAPVQGLVVPRPLLGLARPASPRWTPGVAAVEPGPLTARELRTGPPAGAPGEITVRAGDSLWNLAASRLGPFASDVDIAREWPRLYQANRAVIGESPDLLRPGQVLRLPSDE